MELETERADRFIDTSGARPPSLQRLSTRMAST